MCRNQKLESNCINATSLCRAVALPVEEEAIKCLSPLYDIEEQKQSTGWKLHHPLKVLRHVYSSGIPNGSQMKKKHIPIHVLQTPSQYSILNARYIPKFKKKILIDLIKVTECYVSLPQIPFFYNWIFCMSLKFDTDGMFEYLSMYI